MAPKNFAVAVLILAGSASFADDVSPGAAMMAKIAGVVPGAYSVAEIIRLEDARDETSQASETRYILNSGGADVTRTASWTTGESGTGADQLARNLGLEPGTHSIAELVQMKAAKDENDRVRYNYFASGTNRQSTDGDIGRVTPAKAQIAASLNVDPASYSLSELVEMQTTKNFGGNTN